MMRACRFDCGQLMQHVDGMLALAHAVKSPNYLVDQHWGVKVSDFNLSRLLGDNGLAVSSAGPANPVWLVSMWGFCCYV